MSDILIESPVICDECGSINGHSLRCSKYVKSNVPVFEQLLLSKTLLQFRTSLLDECNYHDVIALTGVEISKLQLHVNSLYNHIELPTEDDMYYYEELIETLMILPNYGGYGGATTYSNSQKDDELVLNKNVSTDESTGNISIELSSYVTGIAESKPTDVVLMIDHSGSMHTAADVSKPIYDINNLDVSKIRSGYYVAYPKTGSTGYLLRYENGNWISDKSVKVTTYRSGRFYGNCNSTPEPVDTVTFNSSIFNNYIYAVSITGELYDALEIFMDEMRNAIDCRVAIATFSGTIVKGANTVEEKHYNKELLNEGVDYLGSGIFVDGELMWDSIDSSLTDSQYADAFEDPTTEIGYTMLNNAINAISTSYGYTPTAIGLMYARRLFEKAGRSNSEKVAIIFTDGVPSPEYIGCKAPESCEHTKEDYYNPSTNKYNASYLNCDYCNLVTLKTSDGKTDYGVRTTYVDQAYKLKTEHNATIYSIGASSGNAGYDVLKNIATSESHVFGANGEQTKEIFHNIASLIVSTSQELNSNTILVDALSDYFELPSYVSTNGDGIEVYTSDCIGENSNGEYIFDNPIEFIDADINVDKENNRVYISNFDYKQNVVACFNGVYTGKKLIVNIPIIPSDDFVGGDDITTNDSSSGIYNMSENGSYTSIKPFEIPYFEPNMNFTENQNGGAYHGFIKLSQNTIIDGTISIEDGKILILDLNGFVLQSKNGNRVIDVKNGGKIIIIDSNPNNSNFGCMSDGIWSYGNGLDFEIKGGIITGCILSNNDGAIYNNGEIVINGGTIVGNKCDEDCAAIYSNNGNVIMQDGSIKYNQTPNKKPSNVLLNNGSFQYYDGNLGFPYYTGLKIVNGTFEDKSNSSKIKHELHLHYILSDSNNKDICYNARIQKSKWITIENGDILHKEDCDNSTPTWADLFPNYEFVGWESKSENDTDEIVNLYAILEER